MKFRRVCSSFDLPAASQKKRSAFTLVELLVVIGIIALLISILLPALGAARRQAAAIKCASSLRDIGNAFVMYSMDNHGYAPACKLLGTSATPYALDGYTYAVAGGTSAYWFNFLAKYETKTHVGYSDNGNANNASIARQSIFWACPAWSGYTYTDPGGLAITQTGYGMNGFPEYSPSYPPTATPPIELGEGGTEPYDEQVNTPNYKGPGWSNFTDRWYKLSVYQTHGSERCLAGDCLFWFIESRPPSNPISGQMNLTNGAQSGFSVWSTEADGAHQSNIDVFRHGIYPKTVSADLFSPTGGKVSFNLLFADGHVTMCVNKSDAYQTVRMKFPG